MSQCVSYWFNEQKCNLPSGQFIINPEPECFGHFGTRISLLFTTFWVTVPGTKGRYCLAATSRYFSGGGGGTSSYFSIRWPMGKFPSRFPFSWCPPIFSNESPKNGPNSRGFVLVLQRIMIPATRKRHIWHTLYFPNFKLGWCCPKRQKRSSSRKRNFQNTHKSIGISFKLNICVCLPDIWHIFFKRCFFGSPLTIHHQ